MMGPIRNAKDMPLLNNSSALPNVSGALLDYFQDMVFTTLVKSVVNFQSVETPTNISTMGVIQPFSPQQLEISPSGERAWQWWQLHALPNLILYTDDTVTYNGVQYRVMSKQDYSQYGYVEYHLIQDFTGSGP